MECIASTFIQIVYHVRCTCRLPTILICRLIICFFDCSNSSSFIGAFSWTDQYNSVLEQVSNRGRNTNNNGMNSGMTDIQYSILYIALTCKID